MHMCRLLGLLLSVLLLGGCNAFQRYTEKVHGRILCIFATRNEEALRYHLRLASFLARYHDVTVVSVLPLPTPYHLPNFKYVRIATASRDERPEPSSRLIKMYNQWQQYAELDKYFTRFMEAHPPGTYNLVILSYFYNIRHLLLAGCYRVPIILTTEMGSTFVTNTELGNPREEGYLPSEFTESRIMPQSYLWRFLHVLGDKFIDTIFRAVNAVIQWFNKETTLHFNCQNVKMTDVRRNISLVFTNHHYTQGPVRPNVPSVVEIGGIQIPEQLPPLEQHIADHINKAEKGVIYINLGKSVNCTYLPEAFLDELYLALVESGMTVLWRWTLCSKPRESSQILYTRWMPQNSILAQKSVKLFITHGSMASLAEGQYHAVPMLAITYLSEQVGNVEYLAQFKLAMRIDAYHTNALQIRWKIFAILNDPTYKQHIDVYSRVYRDRPMSPRETVLYWVNYVIRYRGTPHMRSPAADMSQLEMLGLDLVLYTLVYIILLWKCHTCIFNRIICRIFYIIRKLLRKYVFVRDYDIVIERSENIRYDEAVVDIQRECQIRRQDTEDPEVPRVVAVNTPHKRKSGAGRRKR